MAKDVDTAQETPDELEEVIKEAKKTTGATPREITVLVRELSKMFEAVKLSEPGEMGIGTYFVPLEGQLGIEGLVNQAAAYMNDWVQKGWRPWQMGTPYLTKTSFDLPGGQTGELEGQWITIIWLRPVDA